MLNPLWLKTFAAAAGAPSFTEAARRLGLTQPTVSEHIRQLEQAVNRRLFQRDTHSLALTSDGRSLLVHAEIILAAHEKAERLFDAPRLRGRIRLGTSDDLAMGPLPDVLAAFRLAHPEVELDLTIGVTSDLYKLLDDNRLDVMIGKRRRGDRRGQTLHKEALLWRAKEGLRVVPDEPLPLILLREPSVTRTLALDALARAGRSWQIVCTSTNYAGCQAAARAGLGITVQPSHLSTAGLSAPAGAANLPTLPPVEFIVISAPSPGKPTRALTEILMRSTLT
ncbi:LysR family transcriptional regulator [Achromobacter animicus]|uniref:LysR family transcriptional regulator n=1 Tax=Achromobacter animicus TaxID=1389935 RepID=UPI0028A9CEAD|nr:LysR substrate-binding domain-containing protein [Achromobacter animicus]